MATLATLLNRAALRAGVSPTNALAVSDLRGYFNRVSEEIYGGPRRYSFLYKSSTLAISADSRGPYDLPADFHLPLKEGFRDTANDYSLPWSDFGVLDQADPDSSITGNPDALILLGINSSSGVWTIYVYPTPTVALTLAIRYYASIPEFTSEDDNTSMDLYIPRFIQQGWVHGAAAMFLEDRGAGAKAQAEMIHMQRILNRLNEVEVEQSTGLESSRMERPRGGYGRGNSGLLAIGAIADDS